MCERTEFAKWVRLNRLSSRLAKKNSIVEFEFNIVPHSFSVKQYGICDLPLTNFAIVYDLYPLYGYFVTSYDGSIVKLTSFAAWNMMIIR